MMPAQRVALVTGASRGIGRAIAIALAKDGCDVAVNYRSGEAQAAEVVREIGSLGRQSIAVRADVASSNEVAQMVERVLATWGRIDVLVNNAGIVRDGLVLRMDEDAWDQVVDTNLKGAFFCIRAALRAMLKQRSGRIVNVSSVAGVVGNAGQANYAAAKAGLLGLTRAVAKEVAPRGITVNAVAPGFIETDMTEGIAMEYRDRMKAAVPLNRFGQSEEVAEAVRFLASRQAGYITGEVIKVDGGLAMC